MMTRSLHLVALATLLAAASATPAGGQRAPTGAPLPVDTQVRVGVLPNGLRYYVRENREPASRAELRLAVNAGSILEDRRQLGLAHFLEHMAFNGTRSFARQDLVDYLESVGMRFGPDVNAYTSFDETVYMLTVPTDSAGVLESGIQILEDWAHGIELDSLEIEKERGVVIEEWRLGQSAAARMQREQLPVLMRRSRYSHRSPIGTLASLTRFSHRDLRRFYRDWYRPDLMAVVAVGDFDADSVETLIRAHFSGIEGPRRPRRRIEYDVPDHRQTLVSVATDPEATSSSVSLYLKRRPRPWTSRESFRDWLVESLVSSMLTNRLSEWTQRPNSPFLDVSSFHGRFIRPLAAHVLSVRVPDGGIERGVEALLGEAERAARHGFTATELEREKRELLRYVEQRFTERTRTTSSSFASEYVSNFLYGGSPLSVTTEYELYRELLPLVQVEEVNARAGAWMKPQNRVVLVRAPERRGGAPPSEARIARIVSGVERRPLEPYVDSISHAPLMASVPEPGRIVAERRFDEVGIREWTLSNGARILLKPTEFREDEVLFAAQSPGGMSLLPDSDYLAALTATAVVQVGGLGELSSTELRKRLTGRMVGVGADISELHESLSGAAAPQDLETLFQLVHLRFTAPRPDSVAFTAYRQQARASLANRSARPEEVFADTLRVVLSQHHPRVRPPAPEMFDSLDFHRSVEIYRDRFADASDFTFYLVGSFDPDSVRPLVERYIASLPGIGREERGRDVGIRPPRGIVERTVYRGAEPKALTRIVFTGPFEFGLENLQVMSVLGEVLRLRLREVLREDLGGTYGVEVGAFGSSEPRPAYQISIGFGADPHRIDELTRVVFAELDSLKLNGPRATDLAKVREMQIRSREIDQRRNHFWISQILGYDRNGWDFAGILDLPARVAAVSAEQVREAAALYLDAGNYVRVTLLPAAEEPRLGSRDPAGTELPES